MQVNKTSNNPRKRCQNCGLPGNRMFCCEWCLDAYLARQNAHRVARRRQARSQSDKGSAPGANQAAAED